MASESATQAEDSKSLPFHRQVKNIHAREVLIYIENLLKRFKKAIKTMQNACCDDARTICYRVLRAHAKTTVQELMRIGQCKYSGKNKKFINPIRNCIFCVCKAFCNIDDQVAGDARLIFYSSGTILIDQCKPILEDISRHIVLISTSGDEYQPSDTYGISLTYYDYYTRKFLA